MKQLRGYEMMYEEAKLQLVEYEESTRKAHL